MRVRFFGTRGSIATPGPDTLRYGGNTSCIEVQSSAGALVILDMGTGATVLGRELMARGEPSRGHILISHTHWDHIAGIPFFAPLFVPGFELGHLRAARPPPGLAANSGWPDAIHLLSRNPRAARTIRYRELVEGRLRIGDIEVTCRYLDHPALTFDYRTRGRRRPFVYACDHRSLVPCAGDQRRRLPGEDRRHAEALAGANLVRAQRAVPGQRIPAKDAACGPHTIEYAYAVARLAKVGRLAYPS